MTARNNILVPDFEREMLLMRRVHDGDPRLRAHLDEALRLAILFSHDAALVPAPGFFETSVGYDLVRRFAPSVERGQLALLGSGGHPSDYADRKLHHFAGDNQQLDLYGEQAVRRMAALDGQGWRPKQSSTDQRLAQLWQEWVELGTHPLLPVWRRSGSKGTIASEAISNLPGSLEGRAIVVDHITQRLPRKVQAHMMVGDTHDLRTALAGGFFSSYVDDGHAVALIDSRLPASSVIRTTEISGVETRRLRLVLRAFGLLDAVVLELSEVVLAQLVDTPAWQTLRPEVLRRAAAAKAFEADELVALRRIGTLGHLRPGREVPTLERHLERIGVALSSRRRRRPGASTRPGQIELFKKQGEATMGGTHFHGETTINGSVINLERGGQVDARAVPVADLLAEVLPRVLGAPNPTDAEQLLQSLETLMAEREVDARTVAELVETALAGEVEKSHPNVRRRLADLGTSATAGVIAQGIMLGVRAVIGA